MALQSFDDADSDEARQYLLDRRCERRHPKRHRTMKRAKGFSAKKRARVKARLERRSAAYSKYLDAARSYWAGDADGHPEAVW